MPQKNDSSDGRPLRGVAAIPKSLLSWLNDCVGAHSSGCALTSRLQHKPLCADFLLGDYRMVALCVKMGSLSGLFVVDDSLNDHLRDANKHKRTFLYLNQYTVAVEPFGAPGGFVFGPFRGFDDKY